MAEARYTYRIVDPEWENEWQVEDGDGIAAITAEESDAARIAACLNACLALDTARLEGLAVAGGLAALLARVEELIGAMGEEDNDLTPETFGALGALAAVLNAVEGQPS